MKKFINTYENMLDEYLRGFVELHKDKVIRKTERVVVWKDAPVKGKVGVVTGGGSGHDPFLIGSLGKGMVDAVAIGNIFAAPGVQLCYDAIKAADHAHDLVGFAQVYVTRVASGQNKGIKILWFNIIDLLVSRNSNVSGTHYNGSRDTCGYNINARPSEDIHDCDSLDFLKAVCQRNQNLCHNTIFLSEFSFHLPPVRCIIMG